jgi:hypothetical protein
MRRAAHYLLALTAALSACRVAGQPATPAASPARLPVREVTVFKDGHAFVLHQGKLPVTGQGTVLLDHLPVPVLGTFWPYSVDPAVKLASVTAGQRDVMVERTAITGQELIRANPGAHVRITQIDGKVVSGQIVGVPEPDAPGMGDDAAGPEVVVLQNGRPALDPASLVLLKTPEGVTALPIMLVRSVTFKGDYQHRLKTRVSRNLLTLKLDRAGGTAPTADVGLVYLQRGIRWIPSYRVNIDGKGSATVELQATVINEMVDLEGVTANLVIGVPNFFFKDTPDPISLQQTFPQLSRYFQPDSQTGFAFSNAIMSQGGFGGGLGGVGRCGEAEPGDEGDTNQAPDADRGGIAGDKNEDLFVFTLRGVTLKKGQSMVLPVAKTVLKYRDVYTVDLAFAPPPDVNRGLNMEQQAELARLLRTPRAQHRIRLENSGQYPITTAPALVVSGDRVVSQTMTSYTPTGGVCDLSLTTSPDIQVQRTDRETKRTPDAAQQSGNSLALVELAGSVKLRNLRGPGVDVEVTRYVLGNVQSATNGGNVERINVFEDEGFLTGELKPGWWRNYSWPSWWFHRNGIGKITWKLYLEPEQPVELGYTWSYYAP